MKKLMLSLLLISTQAFGATQPLTVTFTGTAQQLTDATNDLADFYGGYSSTLPGGANNPESKLQFITRMVAADLKDHVKFQRGKKNGAVARDAAFTEVDAITVN